MRGFIWLFPHPQLGQYLRGPGYLSSFRPIWTLADNHPQQRPIRYYQHLHQHCKTPCNTVLEEITQIRVFIMLFEKKRNVMKQNFPTLPQRNVLYATRTKRRLLDRHMPDAFDEGKGPILVSRHSVWITRFFMYGITVST